MWTPWRNGSASDSRSEGCVFKSRRGQCVFFLSHKITFILFPASTIYGMRLLAQQIGPNTGPTGGIAYQKIEGSNPVVVAD